MAFKYNETEFGNFFLSQDILSLTDSVFKELVNGSGTIYQDLLVNSENTKAITGASFTYRKLELVGGGFKEYTGGAGIVVDSAKFKESEGVVVTSEFRAKVEAVRKQFKQVENSEAEILAKITKEFADKYKEHKENMIYNELKSKTIDKIGSKSVLLNPTYEGLVDLAIDYSGHSTHIFVQKSDFLAIKKAPSVKEALTTGNASSPYGSLSNETIILDNLYIHLDKLLTSDSSVEAGTGILCLAEAVMYVYQKQSNGNVADYSTDYDYEDSRHIFYADIQDGFTVMNESKIAKVYVGDDFPNDLVLVDDYADV